MGIRNVLNVTPLKLLRTGIDEGDNATSVSSPVVNFSNLSVLGRTPVRSSNCASKCISLVLGLRSSCDSLLSAGTVSSMSLTDGRLIRLCIRMISSASNRC